MRDMADEYIPLAECKHKHLYRIHARNLTLGVFDGKTGFTGIRTKFGARYLDTEHHWDEGPPFGTVKPIEDLGAIPDDMTLEERVWLDDHQLFVYLDEVGVSREKMR